jgi:hypothetical protein
MRVKESKELNELATLSGKPAKQVSDIIVSELLNKKIIAGQLGLPNFRLLRTGYYRC